MSKQSVLLDKITPQFATYQFTLMNDIEDDLILITQPDGWDDEYIQTRSEMFKGVYRTTSEQVLTFAKEGRDWLRNIKETQGVIAKCYLKVEKRDFENDWGFIEILNGYLNLETYKDVSYGIEVQVEDQGELYLLWKRRNMEIDVTRTTTLEGEDIGAISQELFLSEQNFAYVAKWNILTSELTILQGSSIIPYNLIGAEFEGNQTPVNNGTNLEKCFYINNSDEAQSPIYTFMLGVNLTTIDDIYVQEVVYNESGVEQFRVTVDSSSGDGYRLLTWSNGNTIPVGWGISLQISVVYDQQFGLGIVLIDHKTTSLNYRLQAPSLEETTIQGVQLYTAFKRLIKIISGLDFDSDYFRTIDEGAATDGVLGFITQGYNIRGGNGRITVTLDKLFKMIDSFYNCSLAFDGTTFYLEQESDVYIDEIGLDLTDRIADGDIEIEMKQLFNSIEIGNAKYSEDSRNGINEYNTLTIYSTTNPADNKLELINPYRSDTTGIYNLRQYSLSEEISKSIAGDDDIFYFVCQRNDGDVLGVKEKDNGYDVFPVDDWYNLDITPARCLRRHTIKDYIYAKLEIQKKDKDTTLQSQETGGELITEQSDIELTSLKNVIFAQDKIYVTTYMTNEEVEDLDKKKLIKVGDIEGWIEVLQYNYKTNELVEFELKPKKI